eukprot:SAG22_NODE_11461_length_484_cov_0.740260_1_plen_35_part_10
MIGQELFGTTKNNAFQPDVPQRGGGGRGLDRPVSG